MGIPLLSIAAIVLLVTMVALRSRNAKQERPLAIINQYSEASEACSKAGQNCWSTQCCADPTTQCFEKDLGWAECKPSCTRGLNPQDPAELRTPWTCSVVKPGRCAVIGQNCTASKCCAESGYKCYFKDAGWAECKRQCTPGVDPAEPSSHATPWSCKLAFIPHRLSTTSSTTMYAGKQSGNCSGQYESCKDSNCCEDTSLTCFHRSSFYAECRKDCHETSAQSCVVIVDGRPAATPTAEPTMSPTLPPITKENLKPVPGESPTLYCFALMLAYGYEVSLMRNQADTKAGVFACNGQDVFSNRSIELTAGPPSLSTVVMEGSLQCEFGGPYNLALNSAVFVRVWSKVQSVGEFRRYDWTVKLDPDAVFLPNRLRVRVKALHDEEPMFLDNCASDGLHGPIEVISRSGMEVYTAGLAQCTKTLDQDVWNKYGEDVFLRRCLRNLGVKRNIAFIQTLLTEKACTPFSDPMPCISGAVSFHPVKAAWDWTKCLTQATSMDA